MARLSTRVKRPTRMNSANKLRDMSKENKSRGTEEDGSSSRLTPPATVNSSPMERLVSKWNERMPSSTSMTPTPPKLMVEQQFTKTWKDQTPQIPPQIIDVGDLSLTEIVSRLDTVDEGSCHARRMRSYRSMRRVWNAFMMWLLLLAVSLINSGSSGDKLTHFERIFGNTTIFPDLELHFNRINQSTNRGRLNHESHGMLPGSILAKQGATPKYHIVMIPGFVTSGLELWSGEHCAQKYFRQRIWGALITARSFFTERDCWRKHLALDPHSGGDPPNIKLRAAQGFDAADYFLTAYWVWDKLITNLAEVGYDPSTMSMLTYDWRLAFPLLEQRDGYFTKLKAHIEATHKISGEKVLIASHSMGSQVITYFFAWVTTPQSEGGGGGGHDWVDNHVYSFVNIAGPLLGVPKSVPSILSGEMRDTNVMMGTFGTMVENFFGRKRRQELWSSWGSLWSMLPKGGDSIWGSAADICNGTSTLVGRYECGSNKVAPFLSFLGETDESKSKEDENQEPSQACSNITDKEKEIQRTITQFGRKQFWTLDDTIHFLVKWGAGIGSNHASTKLISFAEGDGKSTAKSWHDPTRTPLPHAPHMKIYCMYGYGLSTERSFFYKSNMLESEGEQCNKHSNDLPFIMDGSREDEEHNIQYGVTTSDGDASVPLLSLGYMCTKGWKTKGLNPSKSPVITREYEHRHEFVVDDPMRSGPYSGDHVDILGNHDMMYDFIKIATGFKIEEVGDKIGSDILNIVDRMQSHPAHNEQTYDDEINDEKVNVGHTEGGNSSSRVGMEELLESDKNSIDQGLENGEQSNNDIQEAELVSDVETTYSTIRNESINLDLMTSECFNKEPDTDHDNKNGTVTHEPVKTSSVTDESATSDYSTTIKEEHITHAKVTANDNTTVELSNPTHDETTEDAPTHSYQTTDEATQDAPNHSYLTAGESTQDAPNHSTDESTQDAPNHSTDESTQDAPTHSHQTTDEALEIANDGILTIETTNELQNINGTGNVGMDGGGPIPQTLSGIIEESIDEQPKASDRQSSKRKNILNSIGSWAKRRWQKISKNRSK